MQDLVCYVFLLWQVVHIATRCFDRYDMFNVTLLVKSVLFYTRHAVKFHILTDHVNVKALRRLFQSWELQHGKCTMQTLL